MQNSSNATEHADYVWKHYVKEGTPKHIAVIAHSYGGFLTVDLVSQWLCTPTFCFFVVETGMGLVTGGTRVLHCSTYNHWFPLDQILKWTASLECPPFTSTPSPCLIHHMRWTSVTWKQWAPTSMCTWQFAGKLVNQRNRAVCGSKCCIFLYLHIGAVVLPHFV